MTDTAESVNATVKRLQNDLKAAQDDVNSALKAFENGKSGPTEQLLELADGVKTAKTNVGKVEGTIKTERSKLQRLEWDAKMGPAIAARDGARGAILNALRPVVQAFKSLGVNVEKSSVNVNWTGDKPTVTINESGPDMPKAPTAKRGGTGGSRGRVTYTTPDGEMSSAELVNAYGAEVLGQERFDKVVADPHGQGLSHIAKRIAKNKGFESNISDPA